MPPDAKENQGKSPEVIVEAFDVDKAYSSLAEKEAILAKQKAEERMILQQKQSGHTKITGNSSEARAELVSATVATADTSPKPVEQPKAQPAAAPASAPSTTPEKEERRYQDSLSKLGTSSICPDLVAIIKKKAGSKVDQNASDSQFPTLADAVIQNLETLDPDLYKKNQAESSGKFKTFRALMEKWIGQESTIAASDKAPHLTEVASNFRNMMDIIEKNEPSTAPAAQPASPSATPTTAPAAAPEAKKPEGFFAELMDKLKGYMTKFTDWISNLFKPKSSTDSAAASTTATAPAAQPSSSPTGPAAEPKAKAESDPSSWRNIIDSEAKRLNIDPAFAMAIVNVEAGKSGLNQDGSPLIRFEAHVFNDQLAKRGVSEKHGGWGSSTLTGRNVDGVSCEGGQASENACFQKALQINKDAAYSSISMGLGQIMGFNSGIVGYPSAEEMYKQFSSGGGGEPEQIRAMFKLIEKVPAQLSAARNKDFAAFARSYNGSGRVPQYSAALQNAYKANGGGSSSGSGTAVA